MTIVYRLIPVTEKYRQIMQLFEDNPGEKMEKYKEKLFGSSMEIIAPDTYNMIGYGPELTGSYPEFKAMLEDPVQIREAAKMIAHTRLKNMIEVIQRHRRLQDETRRKIASKTGNKKGK